MHSLLDPAGFAPQLAEWDFVSWLCSLIYQSMVAVLTTGIDFVTSSTEPELSSTSFTSQFDIMKTVGLYIIVPLMMVQTIMAVLKGSLKELLQSYAVALPAALIGAPISVMLVRLLQAIDTNFVDFIISFSGADANGFLSAIENPDALIGDDPGLGTLLILTLGAIIILIGMIFLLLELAFRSVMLSIGVLFLPLALAAAVWAPTRGFLIKLVETVIILVFSKFISIAVLFFGLGMAFGAMNSNGWTSVEAIVIAGMIMVFACCGLPVMLAFVFGNSAATGADSGSMAIIGQSPLSIKNGGSATRSGAIQGIKDRGKASVAPKAPK